MSKKFSATSRLIELNDYLRANFEAQILRLSGKMNDLEIAKELGLDPDTVKRLKNKQN